MTDGTVATIPVSVASTVSPGSLSFPIMGIFGVSATGSPVGVNPASVPFVMRVLSRCDVNGDGAVNGIDASLVLNAVIGIGTCPLPSGMICTLQSVQKVLSAALGNACTL
jgi:hypothetical protein